MIVLGYGGYTRDLRAPGSTGSPLAKTSLTFENLFRFRDGEAPLSLFPLGFFGHDASAALVRDGRVVACAAEERFTRVKHGLNLAGNTLMPQRAVSFCLEHAGLGLDDVDVVAHYCDFTEERVRRRLDLLRPHVSADVAGSLERAFRSVYTAMLDRDSVARQFQGMCGRPPRRWVPVPHHLAHAASSYFASGCSEALVLTLDGTGECESSVIAVARGTSIEPILETPLPTSLGAVYLAVSVYLGFRSLGDESKVMGLASYGDPRRFRPFFETLVGSDAVSGYSTASLVDPGLRDTMLATLGPPRTPTEPLEPRHADVAAALQEAVERAVLGVLRRARRETGLRRLCMAGGVALNCTLNGRIARSGLFEEVFVQPAAGDDGGSVGAALWTYHREAPGTPPGPRWRHVSLGPEYDEASILEALRDTDGALRWRRVESPATAAAERLAAGSIVGWFQGRMEFGPRALGNRSLLADPRDRESRDRLNRLVKRREDFRPFAPAVLAEEAAAWFDLEGVGSSPFMLFAVPVLESARNRIPAVTHVDGSARVQTVSRQDQPLFWALLREFQRRTGVPVVLNTSFNVAGEPIVCTPRDALRCFGTCGISCLVIGPYLVEKGSAA